MMIVKAKAPCVATSIDSNDVLVGKWSIRHFQRNPGRRHLVSFKSAVVQNGSS